MPFARPIHVSSGTRHDRIPRDRMMPSVMAPFPLQHEIHTQRKVILRVTVNLKWLLSQRLEQEDIVARYMRRGVCSA